MIADNGGKLPYGYKGKLELWMEKQAAAKTKPVSQLIEEDTEDDSDLDSCGRTCAVWSRSPMGPNPF